MISDLYFGEIRKHYGLKEGFPRDQFVVRTEGDQHKIIYFVGRSVKDVLSAKNSGRLKVGFCFLFLCSVFGIRVKGFQMIYVFSLTDCKHGNQDVYTICEE